MTDQSIDRVHFLDEQRRNRRRSRRFTAFAVVAAGVSGIPLCAVVAPLLISVIVVAMHLVDLLVPLPAHAWDRLHDVVFVLPDLWSAMLGRETGFSWATTAMIYVVPGAALMLLTWPLNLAIARRAGAGVVLQRLPSRALDTSTLRERQLSNVVEEMAIAAGVQPPPVRIIDSPAVNALAVGLTHRDAVILATTGFLDHLDRDERQAIIAHLTASIGNGDLEIGATILSVFATWGLIAILLEAPFSERRRRTLRQFAHLAWSGWRVRVSDEEAHEVLDVLLGGAGHDESLIDDIMQIQPRSPLHGCLIIVIQLPIIAVLGLGSITARMAASLYTALGLGPWLSAMWRARRRLADASAVQLTRNPTALARAVRALETNPEVPGGWIAYFLFPAWVPVSTQNASRTEASSNIVGMRLETAPRVEDIVALGAMLDEIVRRPGLRARIRRRMGTWNELRTAVGWGIAALALSVVLTFVTLAAASLLLMALWQVAGWLNPRR